MTAFSARPEDGTATPVLDAGYLERLSGHIGAGVVAAMLDDGVLELADRLTRLSRLAEDGTPEEIADLAHDIAGSSGHLGLSALSQAAVDLSRAARGGTMAALARPIERLLAARDPAMDAVAAYRARCDARR